MDRNPPSEEGWLAGAARGLSALCLLCVGRVIGSYALPGVPLLENAARSGLAAAEALRPGIRRPWTAAATPAVAAGSCTLGAPGALRKRKGEELLLGAVPTAVALLVLLMALVALQVRHPLFLLRTRVLGFRSP